MADGRLDTMKLLMDAPWSAAYPVGLHPACELPGFTLDRLADEAAACWGDRSAITFRGSTWSFSELAVEVANCAKAFSGLGLKRGDVVALLLPNTAWHPVVFLAAMRIGLVIVHLTPLDPPRMLRHKLADSGARTLISTNIDDVALRAEACFQGGLVDRFILAEDETFGPSHSTGPRPTDGGVDSLSGLIRLASGGPVPDAVADLDDLAILQYTGGTTGLPKAAMLTHRNISAAIQSYDLWFKAWNLLKPGEEKVLLYLPLFHIYALTSFLLRGVINGYNIQIFTRFNVNSALDSLEAGATCLPGVPAIWIALTQAEGLETRNLSSLRYCSSGSAPLPVEVARRIREVTGLSVLGGWGMTETAPIGTNIPCNRADKAGTIGVPMPGIWMDVVAVDDPTRVLSPREIGELRIFGPNVTSGYRGRPEETAAAFSQGGLLTGDLGFMDEEGFFTIVDRKKDMILSGGFNVYPQQIEHAIQEHRAVAEAAVVGIPDARRGEAAKAFVVIHKGTSAPSLPEMREFLKGRVGPHEIPVALEVLDALPRTPVGKVNKLALNRLTADSEIAGTAGTYGAKEAHE